jgi:hypothetical protein
MTAAATEVRRRRVDLTDEQIKALWDLYPLDPELIALHCREALAHLSIPRKTGVWTRWNVRCYYDDGFMGSGYLLVHWDDAERAPNCQSNGYCTDPNFRSEEIVWDENPERERLLSIQHTLAHWAYR